jgi:hypothetical protein
MTVCLRSPAEYYIKGLIVHPDEYSNEEIVDKLRHQKLIFYSPSFIDGVRKTVKTPPDPFHPEDETHAASYNYLVNEGLLHMFQRSVDMKAAFNILKKPRIQEFVEALAVVDVPAFAISHYVSRTMRLFCTVSSLELYMHYFWNIDLLSATELRIALDLSMRIAAEYIPELKDRKGVLASPYFKDARKIAADLPHSPIGASLVQGQLGIPQSKQDLALKLMELRNLATLRAFQAVQQNGPGDSQAFLNFVNGARVTEDLLQVTQKPEDQLSEQMQSIALRTSTEPMISVHKLTSGNHTVDVAPIRDPQNDDPDFDTPTGHQDGGG